ncbi:MAG: hypothetical protein ACREKE_06410 [bacterium]
MTTRHTASQSLVSDKIRLLWLRSLGLDPDPGEQALHHAAAEGRWGRSLDWMMGLEAWLLKLRAAGRASASLYPAALDRVLARRWSAALWGHRGLGSSLFSLARRSPLRRLRDPSLLKSWVAPLGAFLRAPAA